MKPVKQATANDVEFHIKEMKKSAKWYSKLCKFTLHVILPQIPNVMLYVYNVITIPFILSTGQVNLLGPAIIVNFLFLSILNAFDFGFERAFGNLFFFYTLRDYRKYLDSLQPSTPVSLESIRKLSDKVPKEMLEGIINKNEGQLHYKDIFGKSISEIFADKKYVENLKEGYIRESKKLEKGNMKKTMAKSLLDSVYDEKK